MHMLNIH